MPALIPVLWSRLPRLVLALVVLVALLAPAVLAQDLQPDPGPELLQPAAPAAPRAEGKSPLEDTVNQILLLLAAMALALLREWWAKRQAQAQRDTLIHVVEKNDAGPVKSATARLDNKALNKRVAQLYPPEEGAA